MKKKSILVLIAGGTCAGKSNLVNKIGCFSKVDNICTDDYVTVKVGNIILGHEETGISEKQKRELAENVQLRVKMEYEWSKPNNVNWEKVLNEVRKALSENPDKVIFVEGMHALQNEELRKMADLKIYSNTDEALRLILKIRRSPWYKKMVGEKPTDPRDFGGSFSPLPFALKSWWNGVRTGEEKYVIPTKEYADLIVDYNKMIDFPKNVEILSTLIKLYFNNPTEFQRIKQSLKAGKPIEEFLKPYEVKRNSDSLHSLIKQICQQKNKQKLKIIVDWDDCLQPVKPLAIYTGANPPLKYSFKQFFHNFWEGTTMNTGSILSSGEITEYRGSEEEKQLVEKFELERQERVSNPRLYAYSGFYTSPERFNAPYTSTAEEVVQALKEDLISELVIITSFRKDTTGDPVVAEFLEKEIAMKKEKIYKAFGQFPQFKLECREVKVVNGNNKPHRWEVIQEEYPDFDLFVNDNSSQIVSVWERLGGDKYYALNDYFHSRHINGPNIYHVKTTLSDLTDEQINQVAEEYKAKYGGKSRVKQSTEPASQVSNNQPTPVNPSPNYPLWISLGLGGMALLGLIGYLLFKKEEKSRKNHKQSKAS